MQNIHTCVRGVEATIVPNLEQGIPLSTHLPPERATDLQVWYPKHRTRRAMISRSLRPGRRQVLRVGSATMPSGKCSSILLPRINSESGSFTPAHDDKLEIASVSVEYSFP